MGRKYDVIDADGHVLEPFTLWDDYMDPKYRERAPKLVKDKDGKERLLLEDKILASVLASAHRGVGAHQGVVAADAIDTRTDAGRFDRMRASQTWISTASTPPSSPSLGLFAGAVSDPAFAAAMCRAYNAGLPITASPTPPPFGIAMLPMQSIDAAIQEMRFARKELGFRGGSCGPTLQRPQAHDPDYEPFWTAAEISTSASASMTAQRHAAVVVDRFEDGVPSTSSRTPWR